MRLRPLYPALALALAAAICLPAAAAPVQLRAAAGTMPASVAKDLKRTLETAIENERAAQGAVAGPAKKRHWNTLETALKYSRTQLKRVAAGAGKYDDPGSEMISHDVAGALKKDADALDEANYNPSISRVRTLIAAALRYKADALSQLNDLAVSAPTPTYGPLGACVFVTNNGNTSTETVKVTDPGAAGFPGTVNFNGQGLNQTSSFTFPSNTTAFLPFNVGVFGPSTITVNVMPPGGPVQTESFQFLLGESNDKTTTDCNTQ